MAVYDGLASNRHLNADLDAIKRMTPTQAYRALGVVRESNDPTPVEPVDLESLPEGKFRTLVVDPTVFVYRCIQVWG